MDILTLRAIQDLPEDAVFALISDSSKECYISHTTNLKSRIGLILTDSDILRDDTKLIILKTGLNDNKYKRIYCQYYLDKHLALGYKNIGESHSYINYKVKVQFSDLLSEALVVLINKRKDKEVVGVFKTIIEAEEFVSMYYSGDMILPVYANNRRTREWLYKH